ncbi:MAG: hypothetical protein ACK4GE_00855 [Caldimicrobium sp.]
MKNLKRFRSEKDLRLFVKNFFKKNIKGLPEEAKIEIKVLNVNPPKIQLFLPFYSEGNLLRVLEVDFLVRELYNLGITVDIFYLDDWEVQLIEETISSCT